MKFWLSQQIPQERWLQGRERPSSSMYPTMTAIVRARPGAETNAGKNELHVSRWRARAKVHDQQSWCALTAWFGSRRDAIARRLTIYIRQRGTSRSGDGNLPQMAQGEFRMRRPGQFPKSSQRVVVTRTLHLSIPNSHRWNLPLQHENRFGQCYPHHRTLNFKTNWFAILAEARLSWGTDTWPKSDALEEDWPI